MSRTDRHKLTTNQNSLFRSRDWLLSNQGPVFPDRSVPGVYNCLYFSLFKLLSFQNISQIATRGFPCISDRPPRTAIEHWKDKIFLFLTQPRSSLYLIRNQRYDRNSLARANLYSFLGHDRSPIIIVLYHQAWRHSHLVIGPSAIPTHVCGDHTRCLCHQPPSGTQNPMIYISHKQNRTNLCVLVTLNCAPHSQITLHTFPENVSLTCLMKGKVITVCAAVPLPLAIIV
eukprot:sb/3469516/